MTTAPDREEALLDAAIGVLAEGGMRQLTHRAVDAAARLPEGSTSNCFRTRESLLATVLDRLLQRETAIWAELTAERAPAAVDELADVLGSVIETLTTDEQALSRARRAVFTEALQRTSLTGGIERGRASLESWIGPQLALVGSPEPSRDVGYLLALVDGLIGARLSDPRSNTDLSVPIAALLRGLIDSA